MYSCSSRRLAAIASSPSSPLIASDRMAEITCGPFTPDVGTTIAPKAAAARTRTSTDRNGSSSNFASSCGSVAATSFGAQRPSEGSIESDRETSQSNSTLVSFSTGS